MTVYDHLYSIQHSGTVLSPGTLNVVREFGFSVRLKVGPVLDLVVKSHSVLNYTATVLITSKEANLRT